MAKRAPRPTGRQRVNSSLFTLKVSLLSGPLSEEFCKKNPIVSRTIQIRGDQTLFKLHCAIFDAFDREDDHLYEFQVGGKGPMDPKARKYVLPMEMKDLFGEEKPAGVVTKATIGSLGLKTGDSFGYWFDFGDDWWHQLYVESIEEKAPAGKYPKVTERLGASPPQYMDPDEEDSE